MPDVDLNVYKYQISDIILTSPKWGDKTYTISNSLVSEIMIVNNYDAAFAPKISLSCQVPYETYYEILAAIKNIDATFSLSLANLGTQKSINARTVSEPELNNNAAFNDQWVQCRMRLFDQGYLSSRDVIDNSLDISNERNTTATKETLRLKLDFFLLDAQKLRKYKQQKSYIVNGNMNDVIYEIFNSRGLDSFLVGSSDSEERSDYAISMGDLGENIAELDRNYGIFNSDYLLYLGLDRNYFIPKGELGTVLEYGELSSVNIYVISYDEAKVIPNVGCYKDEVNKVYILATTDVEIDNVDSLLDFTAGDNIFTVESSGTKVKNTLIGENSIDKAYVLHNPKAESQLLNMLSENKRTLSVIFKNIDLSIITPNKEFNVIADTRFYDQDYEISGKYRLKATQIIFTSNGSDFELTTNISLAKVE